MHARSLTRTLVAVGIATALTACSGTASPSPQSGGGGASSANSSPAGATPAPAGGPEGFEGSLASSGLYAATWSVLPDTAANPFNSVNNPSLASDKSTFGNIKVETDGSVSFGSAATELSKNGAYTGTGATLTLDSSGAFVCAFSIDTDLKGSNDSAILHMSGSMTVHWHPQGVGDMSCP